MDAHLSILLKFYLLPKNIPDVIWCLLGISVHHYHNLSPTIRNQNRHFEPFHLLFAQVMSKAASSKARQSDLSSSPASQKQPKCGSVCTSPLLHFWRSRLIQTGWEATFLGKPLPQQEWGSKIHVGSSWVAAFNSSREGWGWLVESPINWPPKNPTGQGSAGAHL